VSNVAVLEMQLEAAKATESLGLLDAVRIIANSGDRRSKTERFKEWNEMRFLYGERHGDPDRPYAEVGKVVRQKEHMVHEPGQRPNDPDAVTRVDVLYSRLDSGVTDSFCAGPWTETVLTEAKRLRENPPPPKAANLDEAKAKFEPQK
jgi:hypothetical protein